jgi:hypothetical protein
VGVGDLGRNAGSSGVADLRLVLGSMPEEQTRTSRGVFYQDALEAEEETRIYSFVSRPQERVKSQTTRGRRNGSAEWSGRDSSIGHMEQRQQGIEHEGYEKYTHGTTYGMEGRGNISEARRIQSIQRHASSSHQLVIPCHAQTPWQTRRINFCAMTFQDRSPARVLFNAIYQEYT